MPAPEPVDDVWLVTGIPGAGKTTTARLLAASFARGVLIEEDRLQEWIVAGAVWPGEEPQPEADRQLALNRRNQSLLARSFAAAGFVPVLDYVVVSQAQLAGYQAELAGLTLHLVVLAPGRDVALRRDRDRPEKTVAERWAFLEDELIRELSGHGSGSTTVPVPPRRPSRRSCEGGKRRCSGEYGVYRDGLRRRRRVAVWRCLGLRPPVT